MNNKKNKGILEKEWDTNDSAHPESTEIIDSGGRVNEEHRQR